MIAKSIAVKHAQKAAEKSGFFVSVIANNTAANSEEPAFFVGRRRSPWL
jgi:hypothetical protein